MSALRYLIDTTICIYIAKQRPPGVAQRFAQLAVGSVVMSLVTWGELRYGAEKSQQRTQALDTLERLLEQRGILSAADIEAYQPDAAVQEARNVWGRDYIARVLRIVDQDVQAMAGAPEPSIDEVAAELGTPGNDQGKH